VANPNKRQILIPALEFRPQKASRTYCDHLRAMGVSEAEISKVEGCAKFAHVVGGWDLCSCPEQIVREYCHSSFCPRCADRGRKKAASDMVAHYKKLYDTSGKELRLSCGELTIEDLLWDKIVDVELARAVAKETLYEFFGYEESKVALGIEMNFDVWGESHITRGYMPHVHFIVSSLVYDKRAKRFFESPVIGVWKSHEELAKLRSLWRKNLCAVFRVVASVPVWDVRYAFISERSQGAKIAYAQLAQRLLYMYRRPLVDVAKFLAVAVTSKRYPLNFNYAWLSRLLNFYSDTKKRGEARPKHFVRFGFLSDRVQKFYGNLLCKQVEKSLCFKSPSERAVDARQPRCVLHRMSVGRVVSGRGLSIREALVLFPNARIVGMFCERVVGEFWRGG